MAEEVLERLRLSSEQRDVVLFLIRHHLGMSLVAFRRDTEDPDIVKQFAELVGTEERLKMLCLMTLVDIEAVSPDTLTPWKEELLWQLYVDTYHHLTQRYGHELIERKPGLDGCSRNDLPISQFLRSLDFSKGCRSGICSCFHVMRSTATCGWPATSSRTRCTFHSNASTASGRSPSSRSTSRFCSRISAACWPRYGMDILRGTR